MDIYITGTWCMKKTICLSLIILLAACNHPRQKGLVYYNDFESIKGWTYVNLSREKAHSGIYSNKLDSSSVYGETFRQHFFEISDAKVVKVKLSLWAYLTPNAKGKLVVDIRNKDSKTVFWAGQHLELAPKRDEWQKIDTTITFAADSISGAGNLISVFPWNLSKSPIYIDDFRVEFVLGSK
jgi:hypothetical protein